MLGLVSAGQLVAVRHSGPARADAATGTAGLFVPVQGSVLDTRTGLGGVSGPVAANTWYPVQIAGQAGVPTTGVSSVQVSITVLTPAATGLVKLAPDGNTDVHIAALTYTANGGSISASSIVALAADGKIGVLAQTSVTLLVHVQGYYTAGNGSPAPGGYVPVYPTRLVDTRTGVGLPLGKLATGSTTSIKVGSLADVPADASAAFLMLTAISTSTTAGYFSPYPTGTPRPGNVSLNYLANTATISGAAVDLGSGGQFDLWVGTAGSAIDVVVDVIGYYTATSGAGGAFIPAAARVYDSRQAPNTTVPARGSRVVPVGGVTGVPGQGVSAYAFSAQIVHSGSNAGSLAMAPGDQSAAAAVPSLYFSAGANVRSDLVVVPPADDGTVLIVNSSPDPIEVILDVEGWYTSPPGSPIVDSAAYPELSWTPPGGSTSASFAVSDSGTGAAANSLSYSLDGAPAVIISSTATTITLTPPTTLGAHTLSVTAIDRLGLRSLPNDYIFNIGSPPEAPSGVTVTPGAGAADLSWFPGQDNGAPTLGYTFWVVDRTSASASQSEGSCTHCTHFVLQGLDPTHNYAAQVAAANAAGRSAVSTSSDFTALGDPVSCAVTGDDACASQDISQPVNTDPLFANYDLSGTDGGTAAADPAGTASTPAGPSATTDPQCALALADRVGSWACDDVATSGGSSGQPSPAMFGQEGFCSGNGCWNRMSDFEASWSADFAYGWGSTRLGTGSASITWKLVGGRSTSKPVRWKASGQTRNVVFEASMFNGAPGVPHGGSEIHGSRSFSPSTPVVGPATTISWYPNGYSYYNNSMYDHNVVTEFSWNVPGYPGYWYLYARSLCSHTKTLGSSAIYRFGSPTALPGDRASSGWHY